MGASTNRGPKNRPKYIMVLIIGTTKMGPLIFGNIHIYIYMFIYVFCSYHVSSTLQTACPPQVTVAADVLSSLQMHLELDKSRTTLRHVNPRVFLWALVMGPFDSGGVCPHFEYGI